MGSTRARVLTRDQEFNGIRVLQFDPPFLSPRTRFGGLGCSCVDLFDGINHSVQSLECVEVDLSRDGGVVVGIT